MSYVDQGQDLRGRAAAVGATIAFHAALGVALVTGLTIAGYKSFDEYKPIIDFPIDPQPTPTPTAAADPIDPTPLAPMPPIPIPQPPGPARDVFDQNEPVVNLPTVPADPGPVARPDPPRPAPSFAPRKVAPSNDPSRWITNADYPSGALRSEIEGTAGYRLVIGTSGRVSACEITRTSGNGALDDATCKLIARRARFEPATDETGAKVVGSYTGTVRWEIPD